MLLVTYDRMKYLQGPFKMAVQSQLKNVKHVSVEIL